MIAIRRGEKSSIPFQARKDIDPDFIRAICRQLLLDPTTILGRGYSGFYDLATLRGSPPKGVRLRLGNSSAGEILEALHRLESEIARFGDPGGADTLIIRRSP